jgi:RNA polymerase sigma-70 factor (ECF subfamily)
MVRMSDAEIIDKVLAGDTDAFGSIVARHGDMVLRLAVRIVGNRDEAQDVVQEVFVKAYKSLGRWRARSAFSTWLYRIAYNEAVSHIRRRKPMVPVYEVAAGEDDNDGQRYAVLEKALSMLAPDERALVTLFYEEGLGMNDIARITGLSEGNVKVRMHRTRKKLYNFMQDGEAV